MVKDSGQNNKYDRLRSQALAHSRAGRYVEAVQTQIEIINAKEDGKRIATADDHLRFGGFLFLLQNYEGAVVAIEQGLEFFPENLPLMENLGSAIYAPGNLRKRESCLKKFTRASRKMSMYWTAWPIPLAC